MKKAVFIFICVLWFYSCKEMKVAEINIIPKPTSVVLGDNWIEWENEIE